MCYKPDCTFIEPAAEQGSWPPADSQILQRWGLVKTFDRDLRISNANAEKQIWGTGYPIVLPNLLALGKRLITPQLTECNVCLLSFLFYDLIASIGILPTQIKPLGPSIG
jgi:hypothetical protein